MSDVRLSEGAMQVLMTGGTVVNPVLQILGHKKIAGNTASDRYRLLISDGIHLNSFAMLATQLNDRVTSGELSEFSIVQINRHVVSSVNNHGKGDKRVMIILDLQVLKSGDKVGVKIGNPVSFTEGSSEATTANPTNPPPTAQPQAPAKPLNPVLHFGAKVQASVNPVAGSPLNATKTHPIASLSPYQNKWVIKARVTSKSQIRTWSNARGEGKLFSMDLIDESGEIRFTAFRDQVDQFYDILEVNKVYYITRCQLKQANKKFSSLNNDYELTATSDTKIEPCDEDPESIPTLKFNFISLSQLQDTPAETVVDIIGVCKTINDIQVVIKRTTNTELKKRDIVLVDNSLSSVTLTLWGSDAENFDGSGQPVLAVKQGRVSEFGGGKSINSMSSTVLQLNPDIPEAHKLRGWFDGLTVDARFNSLSARGGGGDGSGGKWVTLKESKISQAPTDKADYFSTCAHVMHIRNDNYCYKACPQPDCNKKILDQNTGMYRCEKCNREYDTFKYRLLLSLQLADISDSQWVTCFQDVAETLLGSTADEIGSMTDSSTIEEIFQAPLFSAYTVKLRSKMETYNDETRRKVSIVALKLADNKEYATKLISEIKEMAGVTTNSGY